MSGIRKIGKDELREILWLHELWLCSNGGKQADLSRADLSGADLHKANLHGADLRKANLFAAHLPSVNLSEANLSEADLSRADLRGADLHGADLSEAKPLQAWLWGADLSGANLRKACLHGATMCRAILRHADLLKANLSLADLSGANLTDVVWDASTNLTNANLDRAILPPDFPRPAGSAPNGQSDKADTPLVIQAKATPCPPALEGKTVKSLKHMLSVAELLTTWPADKASSFELAKELLKRGTRLDRKQVENHFRALNILCGELAAIVGIGLPKKLLPDFKDRLHNGMVILRERIAQLQEPRL